MKSILVLVGASGVGKTTLAKELLRSGSFYYTRSFTTREVRRDSHTDEYLYLTKEEFERKIVAGEMLEYMEYGGSYYGTPLSEIRKAFSISKIPLLVLDIQGVKSLRERKLDFDVFSVYLYEDISVIDSRLEARAEGHGVVSLRKAANRRDYKSLPEIYSLFDCFVKNDSISRASLEILSKYREFCEGALDCSRESFKIATELAEGARS